jgi:hypothetical protein
MICIHTLYCNISSDVCTLVFVLLLLLHCFIFILVLLLCYVSRSSLYCNIPSDLCTLVFVLLLLLHCFIFILVLSLCCVSRSSLYCNIPSDLCTLCLSCYYFYIVLSLYVYCCYVVYRDHHFTVIYLQQHNNSTSIKIKQCRSNDKTNTRVHNSEGILQ